MTTRFLMVAVALMSFASAQTVHVPADFPAIQAALDATGPGATIVVAAGTYGENSGIRINSNDAGVTIRSAEGPEVTTIAMTVASQSAVSIFASAGSATI